ncbi:radical SAM protein [Planctomycetales bacterium]|nr:radical SAM protein [Planctomycetales bacterium]
MSAFFDSHCHLQDERFDADRDAVVERAGAMRMLVVGSDLPSSRRGAELTLQYKNIYAAVGVHPTETETFGDADLAALKELAAEFPRVVAVGETGLDYHHEPFDAATQRRAFLAHLALARELNLPVVLHARDAAAEVLDLVAPFMQSGGRAVWHCYSAPKKQLPALTARALSLNLYLGISAMITYEEQRALREQIKQIPDRHLLLDTDSPYLLPRPRVADRNEPANCRRLAEALAEIRGVTVADIARITTRNAEEFLGLETPAAPSVVYPIRDALYVNLTARCNNACVFCARNRSYTVKGHNLALASEPTTAEVIAAIGDGGDYREIVFCGFGEPTMRLDELKQAARYAKSRGKPTRLNTNGLADLQYGREIAAELVGLIDAVSISLNATTAAQYQALCQSNFGERAFGALQDFARACLRRGMATTLTVVEMPSLDLSAAKKIADDIGANFRVRSCVDAG